MRRRVGDGFSDSEEEEDEEEDEEDEEEEDEEEEDEDEDEEEEEEEGDNEDDEKPISFTPDRRRLSTMREAAGYYRESEGSSTRFSPKITSDYFGDSIDSALSEDPNNDVENGVPPHAIGSPPPFPSRQEDSQLAKMLIVAWLQTGQMHKVFKFLVSSSPRLRASIYHIGCVMRTPASMNRAGDILVKLDGTEIKISSSSVIGRTGSSGSASTLGDFSTATKSTYEQEEGEDVSMEIMKGEKNLRSPGLKRLSSGSEKLGRNIGRLFTEAKDR